MVAVRARRRPCFRAAVLPLSPRIGAFVQLHPRRSRPRRGHHPGGVHLGAAPSAGHRSADRVQAVDLRDRQERLHRRVPARPARRRSRSSATSDGVDASRSAVLRSPRPRRRDREQAAARDLRGAFGGLSESHRRMLVMRELEGLSYDEIGERLGMSRQMVESTLFRARRSLAEEYEELASGRRCERTRAVIDAWEGRNAPPPRGARDAPAVAPPVALPAVSRHARARARCRRGRASARRCRSGQGRVLTPSLRPWSSSSPPVWSQAIPARSSGGRPARWCFGVCRLCRRARRASDHIGQPATAGARGRHDRGTGIGFARSGVNRRRRAWSAGVASRPGPGIRLACGIPELFGAWRSR